MKVFYTPRWTSGRARKQKSVLSSVSSTELRAGNSEPRAINSMSTAACPGCRGAFPEIDGPKPAHLRTSVGCWTRFGQALALHYSDHRFWPAHQLVTDAYMLQHANGDDRRGIRLAHVHLAALYAQVRLGQAEARVIALRRALSEFDFKPLAGPWPRPSTTIAAVEITAPDLHLSTAHAYAGDVIGDWTSFHALAERLCRI